MSDQMFSSSSLQTFTAASFILALFALGMGVYNSTRTAQAVSAILDLQVQAIQADADGETAAAAATATEARLGALETRIQALESAAVPAAVATAAP
jgi:hypothetical protein